MADTLIALRQETEAALAVLTPQIRGLDDLSRVSLSEEALRSVALARGVHDRRRVLLQALLAALADVAMAQLALAGDGYPELPKGEVLFLVYQELEGQMADIAAAFARFEPEPVADRLAVVLGVPAEKPL